MIRELKTTFIISGIGILILGVIIGVLFVMFRKTNISTSSPAETIPDDFEVTFQIRLPEYSIESFLTIRADGYAEYSEEDALEGVKFSDHTALDPRYVSDLITIIQNNNFFALDSFYDNPNVTDTTVRKVTVTMNNTTQSVEEYGLGAPETFQAIVEQLISYQDRFFQPIP